MIPQFLLLLWLTLVKGEVLYLDNETRLACANVNAGEDSVGPAKDTYIQFSFDELETPGVMALAIFEWRDYDRIGGVCDDAAIDNNKCEEHEYATFKVKPEETDNLYSRVFSFPLNLQSIQKFRYTVFKSGQYCAMVHPVIPNDDFAAKMSIKSAYGFLGGGEVGLLLLSRISIIYHFVTFSIWFYAYKKNSKHAVPVQKYLTKAMGLLVLKSVLVFVNLSMTNKYETAPELVATVASIVKPVADSLFLSLLIVMSLGYGTIVQSKSLKFYFLSWVVKGGWFCVAYFLLKPLNLPIDMSDFSPEALKITFYIPIMLGLVVTTRYLKKTNQSALARRSAMLTMALLALGIVYAGVYLTFKAHVQQNWTLFEYQWFLPACGELAAEMIYHLCFCVFWFPRPLQAAKEIDKEM
ncbi:YALI0F00792p [Yarrowia lipolytica CLIB122]|uniref:YALI0F00792p n=2 Tax=Yarrowia lipolytica TaxID=4952 RepID=Q6C3C7_YARLI|nr:YALI0F00792p [Yarrowia lipolytica CLIB122]AOW06455.1 hypothetical protein YALI1_F01248g [Yarrowia lipolytica]KAB8280886.1 hypothetical protein BKA91DRAFT_141121 [Yarrowia lipolytica]KAE8170164.1 hypothetical protein BKA90DRAFT_141303 [Yarrowia lipolytica]KAJ8056285.1 hypothetical protein LXG23DRAFT_48192 [Yarrowia lipolytica]RMI94829.1 hypothetical protein BD777DRAFT_130861 [Yarrowia lipolytica]|eukprot:XP_504835.1 YALI0F00792p [Yarrowia lipolytica CLIB122]